MSTTDIQSLVERVKAAAGPDRALDGVIWREVLHNIAGRAELFGPVPMLTASIDAALALVERVLPDRWEIDMGTCGPNDMPWACVTEPDEPCRDFPSSAPTIPLAMLEALLTALTAGLFVKPQSGGASHEGRP